MKSAARITKEPKQALPPAVTALPVRRFTVAEYHELLRVGILHDRDPYELLDGIITPRMPQNTPHASASSRLERRLARMIPNEWILRAQKPVTLGTSEPEPDVAIVRGPEELYDTRHPRGRDIALVVEVSDSSLDNDTGEKLRIYAAARIPVYWIVDLTDRRVRTYTQPRAGKRPTYTHQESQGPDEELTVVLAGTEVGRIPVAELFP
jgi:Uma2 family endonuclease